MVTYLNQINISSFILTEKIFKKKIKVENYAVIPPSEELSRGQLCDEDYKRYFV